MIPLLLQMLRNSSDINCGPLSETMVVGRPCRLKISRRTMIVAVAVVMGMFTISGYLLYASRTTKYVRRNTGPLKSTCNLCHGPVG